MNKSLLILLIGGLSFTSCMTARYNTARSTDVTNIGVRQLPTVAEIDVQKERVEKTDSWQWRLFGAQKMSQRKDNLMADILKESKGDVLVEPIISVEKRWFGPTKLTISGYPATFKNFHTASASEIESLQQVEPVHKRRLQEVTCPSFQKERTPKAPKTQKASKVKKAASNIETESYYADKRTRIMFGPDITSQIGVGQCGSDRLGGGFDISIDYRRYFNSKHRLFWGFQVGLNISDYPIYSYLHESYYHEYSYEEIYDKTTFSTVVMPFRIGYNLPLGEKFSVYAQVSPVLQWHIMYDGDYAPDYLDNRGFDAGLEIGVGIQWKRFSFEVCPRMMFANPMPFESTGMGLYAFRIGWDF